MKRKGFTLVELLAVIAILAILVIIALPNILKMFNDSKKNSFLTEAKTIYSEVSKKYITESMKGNKLTYISSEDNTKLNMTGKELQYCVLLNSDGSVSEMKVSNGTWVVTLPKGKKITDLNASNVTEGNLNKNKCNFMLDSWGTIAKNTKTCINNPDLCRYQVGDTRTIELSEYGKHTVRIANMSTPDECKQEEFSQSACGFVIEFADIIKVAAMNDTNTNKGGWPASNMYKFLNDESNLNSIINLLPSDLKNKIIETKTVSGHGSVDADNFISTDKLYLLAPKEIYADWDHQNDSAVSSTRQLDYYQGTTTNEYSKTIKIGAYWWFRNASLKNDKSYFRLSNNKHWDTNNATSEHGVSPAFRIG